MDLSNPVHQNGFHPKHSGDVVFVLEPSVISYPETGSTHGSGNSYDTHVPLLFYGNGIKKGGTYEKTEIVDEEFESETEDTDESEESASESTETVIESQEIEEEFTKKEKTKDKEL